MIKPTRNGEFSPSAKAGSTLKLLAAKTDGEILLLADSPNGFEVLSRARPLPGPLRALAALANGRLYLRNYTSLICLDVGLPPADQD